MPDELPRPAGPHDRAAPHTPQPTSAQPSPSAQRRDPPIGQPPEHPAGAQPVPLPAAAPESGPAFPALPIPATTPLRVVIADDNPVVRAGLTVLLHGRDDIQVVAEAADGRQAYEAARQHRPDLVLLDVRMPNGVDGISVLPHLVPLAPVLMLTYSRESEIVHEALRLGAGGYLVHGEFTADQLVTAVRDIKQGRAHFTPTASNALLANLRGGDSRHGPDGSGRQLPEGLGTAFAGPGHQQAPPPSPAPPPHALAHGAPPETAHPWPSGQYSPGIAPVSNEPHHPHITSQSQSDVAQSASASNASRAQRFALSQREVEVMELIASGMANPQIAATCFISEKTVKNHINRIFAKLHAATRSEAIAVWLGTARGGTVHHG